MPIVRNIKEIRNLSRRAKRQKMSFSPGKYKMLCLREKSKPHILTSTLSAEEIWESQSSVLKHSQKSHKTLAVTKKSNKTKTEGII